MRKLIFCSMIFFVLLSGACKSKPDPAPQPASTRVPTTGTATPVTTTPGDTTTATTVPDTSTGAAYGTASGTTSGNIGNRHQSGIILDGATTYTVRRGDTLNGIARQVYKDGSLYPLIMMVSGGIVNPDMILPGMRLTIPVVSVNMNDPVAKAAINRYFLEIAQFEEQRGRRGTAELIRNHTR